MDSYTDLRKQCCGYSSGRQNFQPWPPAWGNVSACPSFESRQPELAADRGSCPSTAAGALEQQYPLAMAYVPWQQWQTPYQPGRGLEQGTIFPDLDLPFSYGRCSR